MKDRVAVSRSDAAERDGRLRVGGHIVEPTSRNTGVGLAIVAETFTETCTEDPERTNGHDRLRTRDGRPALVHTRPGDTARDVAGVMVEFRLEELPVLSVERPRVPSQVIGAVDTASVTRALVDAHSPIGAGGVPLPFAGTGERLETVLLRLGSRRGVIVNVEGRPTFLLSSADLLPAGRRRSSTP